MKAKQTLSSVISVSIFTALALCLAGCKSDELQSSWRRSDITIDGNGTDWQESLRYYKNAKIGFRVANDGQHLYLNLVFTDPRSAVPVMRSGVTVWLDPQGGRKKRFGIRYPVGIRDNVRRERRRDRDGVEEWVKRVNGPEAWIEIIGPEKGDITHLPVRNRSGIQVAAGYDFGQLIYELKVPLTPSPDTPYAVGARRGGVVGMGLEAGKIDRIGQDMDRDMLSPVGGAPGRGPRGDDLKPEGRPPVDMPEPLSYWLKVSLAGNP